MNDVVLNNSKSDFCRMHDWKLLLRRLIALQAKANVNIDVSTLNPLFFWVYTGIDKKNTYDDGAG